MSKSKKAVLINWLTGRISSSQENHSPAKAPLMPFADYGIHLEQLKMSQQ